MTKKLLEQMNELARSQCRGALNICEKYGYPNSDEPLQILVDDVSQYAFKACHDIMNAEFEAQKAEMMAEIAMLKIGLEEARREWGNYDGE